MERLYSPLIKGASRIFLAQVLIIVLYVCFASAASAQSYGGPLVITKGGTYSGNWESRDSEVAAVEVRTSEPVIIEHANIRGAGYLIKSWAYSTNLTVRHTSGYGLTPTPYRDYKKPRRFVTVNVFKNLVVENCYMEGTAGIYVGTSYVGNGSSSETVRIRYNIAKNIDGRVYGGTKENSQFVQFNFKGAIRHAEIAWNQVINEADKSLVEDNINISNTRGTPDSPIRIHNNYIHGAFPIAATSTSYSGGGILMEGAGDANQCTAYIDAYENQLVGMGNYSMGIAAGNNIRYHHNRAVNAATFPNGIRYSMNTSGFWSKDYYKTNTTYANSIDNNTIGVVAWIGYLNNRNDISVAENAEFKNNIHLPNPITLQSEKDEYSRWTQKLQAKGIKLGPNGTSAPSNQAPTVSLSLPTLTYTAGTAIKLTANANDADGNITKVEFYRGSTKLGEQNSAPYSLTWSNATVGTHNFTAKAYDNDGASKTSSVVTVQVTIGSSTVVDDTGGSGGSGSITREFWANVHGNSVSQIPVTTKPTQTSALTSFEAPSNVGDTYGQRIRGYVTAPVSGQYTFWIAADDKAELYLSPSEDAGRKTRIAYVTSWTGSREWGKHSTQQSAKVTLEAGKRYYIEALHLEGGGGDNLAVGWQLPNGALERPITGKRLSPTGSTAPATTEPIKSITTSGKISLEFWADVHGNSVSEIPVTTKPTRSAELTSFEAPSNVGDEYGQRIRGYVTAPVSGQYTFWIAADDKAELYLSPSEDAGRKTRIAYVTSWTGSREWGKHSTQQSAKVTLEAGRRYYIEALHLEGGGGDNLAVGWQLPNGTLERPIAGNRLSPMSGLASTSAIQASGAAAEPFFTKATAFPNPFRDAVTLSLGNKEVELAEVIVADQTGRVVYRATQPQLVNNQLKINLADLKAGLYILNYIDKAGGTKSIKMVKE